MEPNISATPSSPVADANGRPAVDEHRPITGENGYAAPAANASEAVLARTNGRTNGHGSAHTNGHAHSRVAIETPARGPAAWRALAGPVRSGVSGGYAAVPSAAA